MKSQLPKRLRKTEINIYDDDDDDGDGSDLIVESITSLYY